MHKKPIKLLPVKSIEVAHTPISFWREIFPVISVKIQLKWELITVVYLHCQNGLNVNVKTKPITYA